MSRVTRALSLSDRFHLPVLLAGAELPPDLDVKQTSSNFKLFHVIIGSLLRDYPY